MSAAYRLLVAQFHEKFGLDVKSQDKPFIDADAFVRFAHITEEIEELREAIAHRDLVATADAIADSVYLLHGLALQCGIDLDAVFEEVHRTNMLKVRVDRDDHKFGITKPEGWTPPDLEHVVLGKPRKPRYVP